MKANPSTKQGLNGSGPAEDRLRVFLPVTAFVLMALCWTTSDSAESLSDDKRYFNIPQQRADLSLTQFAEQAGLTLLFKFNIAKRKTANKLTGHYTVNEAVEILLADTGLHPVFSDQGQLMSVSDDMPETEGGGMDTKKKAALVAVLAGVLAGGVDAQGTVEAKDEDDIDTVAEADIRIPEILVVGRSLNVDIPRNENDPQPFLVFNSEQIALSGAVDVDDFLRTKVPQNVNTVRAGTGSGHGDTRSQINLRGLGADQTLVLVNGRRITNSTSSGFGGAELTQGDVNAIPMAAIERIEILPATASGIYGGGATGGVINVVLKSDYSGFDIQLTYDNSFESDSGLKRLDLVGGHSFGGGRTNITFSASYSEANELLVRERDFAQASRDLQMRVNPDFYFAGFPVVGATPNISSEPQFDFPYFLETGQVRFVAPDLVLDDGTELGTPFTFAPEGYAGVASDGGQALVDNAGQQNLDLDLFGTQSGGGGSSLLAVPEDKVAFNISLRHDFSEEIDGYIEVGGSRSTGASRVAVFDPFRNVEIDADAPTNPFQQTIVVALPTPDLGFENRIETENLSIAGGLIWNFAENWAAALDLSTTEVENNVEGHTRVFDDRFYDDIEDGTFDILRDPELVLEDLQPYLIDTPRIINNDSRVSNYSLRLAGPLFDVGGGAVSFASLYEFRTEEIDSAVQRNVLRSREFEYVFEPGQEQDVHSLYGEMRIPFVSELNGRPLLRQLELQAAIRYEDYTSNVWASREERQVVSDPGNLPTTNLTENSFSSTDITIAGKYSPVQGLSLRASFGTGFLPPSIANLSGERNEDARRTISDPQRGGVRERVFIPEYFSAGNPFLKPEESESFSAGVIIEPEAMPGFRLSVDYVSISKTNEIASVDDQAFIDREAEFPDRVIRGPLEPDAPPGFTAGPIISLDSSLINLAESEGEYIDYKLDYIFPEYDWGRVNVFATATQLLSLKNKLLDTDDFVDIVGFLDGPVEWKANFGATYQLRGLRVNWTAQYFDERSIFTARASDSFIEGRMANTDVLEFSSRTIHDLSFTYSFDSSSQRFQALDGFRITAGIRNIFDEQPLPQAEGNLGGTPGSFFNGVDPRLRTYFFTLGKSF